MHFLRIPLVFIHIVFMMIALYTWNVILDNNKNRFEELHMHLLVELTKLLTKTYN